jgi:hypothetical protein
MKTNSVAFNEYGSNLFKSKLDPLTVFEAKVAMSMGKDEAEGGLDVSGKGMDKLDEEMIVGRDPERKQIEVLSQLGGSQDAPEFDLSSQDQSQPELNLVAVNKERTTSEITPVTIDRDGALAGDVMGIKGGDANEVGRAQISPDWDQIEEGFEEETNTEKVNVTHDETEDGADILREAKGAQEGVGQSFERPVSEQKEVRQSQRIKEQGLGAVSIAEKAALAAQRKNLEGLQKGEEKEMLEAGAEALKNAALHHHPQEQEQEEARSGTVLLQ